MILQRASELTIRAMLFLALQESGKLSPVHEIAEHVGVSEAYLAKILQRLTSTGIVRSFRGPGKGMELARTPSSITLASLIQIIEGAKVEDECVLGLEICTEEAPCALHKEWIPIRAAINKLLEETTLADLAEIVQSHANKPGTQLVNSESPVSALLSREKRRP
jgi:Rrf2 family iron-sulfur cluster assembly transcriptional regulator